jgi:RimJ/RimL family protein N-acetyltransferase
MGVNLTELDVNNADEVEMMYKTRTDPEVAKWLTGRPPKSFQEHIDYLSIRRSHKKFFCIYADGTMVGYCQMTAGLEVELGWAISSRYQGFGYGAMAVKNLIVIAQKYSMQNQKIVLFVDSKNQRAISLYKKNGFVEIENTNDLIKMELTNA